MSEQETQPATQTCGECRPKAGLNQGDRILLCPLHAQAGALLRREQWYGIPEGWYEPEEPWCCHEEECKTLWQHLSEAKLALILNLQDATRERDALRA